MTEDWPREGTVPDRRNCDEEEKRQEGIMKKHHDEEEQRQLGTLTEKTQTGRNYEGDEDTGRN